MATTRGLHQLVVRLPIYSALFLIYSGQTARPQSALINECVDPGDILIYECTVTGELFTVWIGSAFDCPNSNNEIVLRPTHFLHNGTSVSCNNGTIVARSLSVEGNNYTSQLNVTVTPGIAGKTIKCESDDGRHAKSLSSWTIPTVTEALLPPNKLEICNVNFLLRQLTFSWSLECCPLIHYNILASNCGSCPTTTNHTNVTCTDIPTNGSILCSFAIQTVVCGNITGNASDPINITFHATEPMTASMDTLCPTHETLGTNNPEGIHNLTVYIAFISSLAAALIVTVVISITVMATILRRSKAKIKAALSESSNRVEGTTQMESVYDEITGPASVIDTHDNIAYSRTKTSTTAM